MAGHPRLGAQSALRALPDEVLQRICDLSTDTSQGVRVRHRYRPISCPPCSAHLYAPVFTPRLRVQVAAAGRYGAWVGGSIKGTQLSDGLIAVKKSPRTHAKLYGDAFLQWLGKVVAAHVDSTLPRLKLDDSLTGLVREAMHHRPWCDAGPQHLGVEIVSLEMNFSTNFRQEEEERAQGA